MKATEGVKGGNVKFYKRTRRWIMEARADIRKSFTPDGKKKTANVQSRYGWQMPEAYLRTWIREQMKLGVWYD